MKLGTFKILRADDLVGTAKIEWEDEGMGTSGGSFTPGPGYSVVEQVFRAFAEAGDDPGRLHDYYRRRDGLKLRIEDARGALIPGVVHIIDYQAEIPDQPILVEIYPE